MSQLPSGTVTFLFTDIEGSTGLWQQHPAAMPDTLARHHAIMRKAIESNSGYVFQIVGDGFYAAFATACDAVNAALAAQRALGLEFGNWKLDAGNIAQSSSNLQLRVRMALHTGMAEIRAGEYTSGEYASGPTLNRCARLLSAGHGGQVLLSHMTRDLVVDDLPDSMTLRDLGLHRLKDLSRAERIYQLVAADLPSDFPTLKTADARPNNLPIQITSFIGREKEIREVRQLVHTTRLVTLTGAGGSGKTRLALQLVTALLEAGQFPDGVWFVELAPLADPALVPQSVASALGVREQAGYALLDLLKDFLRSRQLLLILDNCEHLIEACAQFADTALHATSQVKILATSREALGITGECTFPVPSLQLPDQVSMRGEALARPESVRLFVERATAAHPPFALNSDNAPLVAQICRRLDGIPLAIELAAARVNALAVEQIAQRLDDRFRLLTGGSRTALPRQQTLRALIDWSYNLLSAPERLLLHRLSVFAGGWTLEAAEQVCTGDGIEEQDVLDLLTRLVAKSLVLLDEQPTQARYRFLETIRQYARDRLLDSDEERTVKDRHLDYYLKFALEAETQLHGPAEIASMDRLDSELDNLRAALDGSLREGRAERGLRLVGTLWWFWRIRHLREGYTHAAGLLKQPVATPRTLTRAGALWTAAITAGELGDSSPSREYREELVTIARGHGPAGRTWLALGLGYLARVLDDPVGARAKLEEALDITQSIGDRWTRAFILNQYGLLLTNQRDYPAARQACEEALALCQTLGDTFGVATSTRNLGRIYVWEGNLAKARRLSNESLLLFRETKSVDMVQHILIVLGEIARADNRYAEAKALYQEALETAKDLGLKDATAAIFDNMGFVALRDGELENARVFFSRRFTDAPQDLTIGAASNLIGFAGIAAVKQQGRRAARLLAAANVLLTDTIDLNLTLTFDPADEAEYERYLALARQQLDEDTFNTAWNEGRAMNLEQAIAYALEDKPTTP